MTEGADMESSIRKQMIEMHREANVSNISVWTQAKYIIHYLSDKGLQLKISFPTKYIENKCQINIVGEYDKTYYPSIICVGEHEEVYMNTKILNISIGCIYINGKDDTHIDQVIMKKKKELLDWSAIHSGVNDKHKRASSLRKYVSHSNPLAQNISSVYDHIISISNEKDKTKPFSRKIGAVMEMYMMMEYPELQDKM